MNNIEQYIQNTVGIMIVLEKIIMCLSNEKIQNNYIIITLMIRKIIINMIKIISYFLSHIIS